MSYHRRNGLGDGAITDPSQVDSTLIGTVAPTRVDCAALPADSPWKQPGQVCAPSSTVLDFFNGVIDRITGNTPVAPTAAVTPATPDTATTGPSSNLPSLLLLAAVGGVGYYLLRKKRRA